MNSTDVVPKVLELSKSHSSRQISTMTRLSLSTVRRIISGEITTYSHMSTTKIQDLLDGCFGRAK